MGNIRLENIGKTYSNGKQVFQDFSMDIREGSFTVLVGPSGCGKTTALRIIAGLEPLDGGRVWIGGRDVTRMPPGDRGIAMVFQNYALYPHMTVADNILYGLKNCRVPKKERERVLEEVLALVGLTEYRKTKPGQLSGGQRQRVALARAISKKPEVFLMDEPLSNLDAKLRIEMRSEIIRLFKRLRSTFVYITHDQVEAMTMGEYIAVINEGKIMQYGTPEEIYHEPANVFTARFIGDPGMNILYRQDGCALGFRCRKFLLARPEGFQGISLCGVISTKENLGSEYQYTLITEDKNKITLTTERDLQDDRSLCVYVPRQELYAFGKEGARADLDAVFPDPSSEPMQA